MIFLSMSVASRPLTAVQTRNVKIYSEDEMSAGAPKRTWSGSAFCQLSKFQSNSLELDGLEADTKRKKRRASATSITVDTDAAADVSSDKIKAQKSTVSSTTVPNASHWIECFAPTSLEDVAVHPKKLAELHTWLQHCDAVRRRHPAQLCLLSGPTGAGKTAAVRATAKACHYQLQEWINPLDQEVVTALGDQMTAGAYTGSQLDAFKSFLLRASRYKSLLEQFDKRLLLVEDFPNALLGEPAQFEAILEEYSKYGKSPLLFIVADSKSRALNISYKLFSDQLKQKFCINHISFNPVASTLLQKAMKRFCALMRQPAYAATYKIPAQTVVDSIVLGAQGDVRNALLNLHFAALRGADPMPTKQLQSMEQQKRKQKRQQSTLKSIGRDESITMLHAVGRVFNPKYGVDRRLVHSPEDISEQFVAEPKKFTDLLHANYLPHFRDIETLIKAADGLSLSDIALNEYRDDSLLLTGLNLAVRSLMVANTAPVPGWMPVRGQKRWPTASAPPQLCGNVSPHLYASEWGTYVRLICGERAKVPINTKPQV